MEIIIAEHAGFCFGVRNAIQMATEAQKHGSVCTLGELIHNSMVIEELERQGIRSVDSIERIDTDQVVIRSHGAVPEIFGELALLPVKVIDTTCPFVRRIQQEAERKRKDGFPIILIGDRSHPEVVATNGWAGGNAYIVGSLEDVSNLPPLEKVCVLGQTTFSVRKRDELLAEILKRTPNAEVFDFICATTGIRQREAEEIAKKADAVLVLGDAKSANTGKLALSASKHCGKVFRIQDEREIPFDDLPKDCVIGILAGASTPPEVIDRVVKRLETGNFA